MQRRRQKVQRPYVRRVFHEKEWWFSVVDVIAVITKSVRPNIYWSMLKQRLRGVSQNQPFTNCEQLKLEGRDGRQRLTDCANIEGIYDIIQHIPSKKAAAFQEPPQEWSEEIIEPDLDTFETLFYMLIAGYPRGENFPR